MTDFLEFTSSLKTGRRLLGLDHGTKTIGLALSDIGWKIASPLHTIKCRKFTKDSEVLIDIIKEHNICGLVIGLPINMNGSEGKRCQSVRQFARNFTKLYKIPVFFQDERMSTMAAVRVLKKADMSHKKQKDAVDKMAASYILQGFLDRLSLTIRG